MTASKPGKPKKLTYLLVDRLSERGCALYDLLEELVDHYHKDIREARIALAWNLSWQPDVDGRCTLGTCHKASDLDRELAPFDFVISLRRDFVEDPLVTDDQRRALLDHELCHAAVSLDSTDQPVVDEKGRIVYRLRKHDLEEFAEIAERYGCWKKDLEQFAHALDRARQAAGDERVFVGFQSVRAALISAGITLPLDAVVEWNEAERREAMEWVAMRRELARIGSDGSLAAPAHVLAAAEKTQVPA